MPSKNIIKPYLENSYYHLYNRGVAQSPIFLQAQDYKVLLSYLQDYLSAPPTLQSHPSPPSRQLQNFHQDLSLISYCLMPNHFHFLVYQKQKNTISQFMRSLYTRYSMYFNRSHNRVGPLFQGNYKGVLIQNDAYLLQVSKYIHRNPIKINPNLHKYPFSSYANFLGKIHQSWVLPQSILEYFSHNHPQTDYQEFVTEITDDMKSDLPLDSYRMFQN